MEKKILTGEQKTRLNEIRNHWLNVRLAVGPADRARVQDGIARAYREAKLNPPHKVVWVDSPHAGCLVANELDRNPRTDCGSLVRLTRPDPIWWPDNRNEFALKVCDVIPDADGFSGATDYWSPESPDREMVGDQGHLTGGRGENPVWYAAVLQISAGAKGMWWSKREAPFLNRHRIPTFVHGREGARNLAYREALDVLSTKDFAGLPGMGVVAEEASWWWPFEKVAVICERPIFERRDSKFRLHNESGPALVYADGYSICALHGRKVPPAEILTRTANTS